MRQRARVGVTYVAEGRVRRSSDGRELDLNLQDTFRGWWAAFRWNWTGRHYRLCVTNLKELFTKILWRKIRRPR